ncbi:MAG: sigma 54-interacting transcriptional regulator [Pirellulales bacterium]
MQTTRNHHCLVLLNGPTPGAAVELDRDVAPLTIGRELARDLPIDDHQVSRLHARVWHDGHAWQIEDCDSRNGTVVNAQRIDRTILKPGDLIRIGQRLIVFLQEDAEGDRAAIHPSALARSTFAVKIASSAEREAIIDQLRGESSSRPLRNLSLLCRLATSVGHVMDHQQLAQQVIDTLCQANGATDVTIYLNGADGRLRPCGATATRTPTGKGRTVSRRGEHLLASVAIDRNEAVLVDLDGTPSGTGGGNRNALAIPIPGERGPRGAIECYTGDEERSRMFDRHDLDFAVAVSHLLATVLENLEHRLRLEQANEQLRSQLDNETSMVGKSSALRLLFDQIGRVAPTPSTVLIRGESGTGKELVAQLTHRMSARSNGPFVAVNCAAFSESLLESELFGHEAGAFTGADRRRLGQFERAHLGTIFLDEVGEMSAACQAKLLRLLEGHPFERLGGDDAIEVDVRIVAATHRDLRKMADDGKFREDLYYRLRVIELIVPPLRERGDDILELAVAFLERLQRKIGRGPTRLSRQAAQLIVDYAWPGNVRELKNAIERAVVLGHGPEVMPEDLALAGTTTSAAGPMPLVSLDEVQRRHIRQVLDAVDGNKTKACKILGIGRGTLYKKLSGA